MWRPYTSHDLPATLIDGRGNATTFAYDGFDRLSTVAYPLGSSETFTYDGADNVLTRTTRANCTIGFAYDTLNRLVTKTIAVQGAPCVGSPAATQTTNYAYDLAGQLTVVSDNSASIQPVAIPTGGAIYTISYAYDALNQLTGATWSPAPAAVAPVALPPVIFGHTYNPVNQRIGQTVSDNSWIAYPPATPSVTSYTANALNQYTAVGAVTPTYDGNGNVTFDGTNSLAYDPENRLVSATAGAMTATYAYDAQGRRKARSVGGTTTVSVTDTDGREVLEYDGTSGALQRWYAYGLGPNDLLNQMNGIAGTRATVIPDLLGSVIALLDSATGTLTKSGYLVYGASTDAPDSFGYTGQRIDPETGLYYYRSRHYSPFLGRFLQADPLAVAAGLNFYAYVDSDPLNAYDPYGLSALQAVTDAAHVALTVASFCPSLCGSLAGGIDAAIYAAQGQYTQAAISSGAALAGLVSSAGAVKVAAVGAIAATDALKLASGVGRVAPTITNNLISVASGAGRVGAASTVRLIQRGEKISDIVNEAKGLTFTTGNEHALVTLAGGQRALVSGGPGGIQFGEGAVTRIFGHTHPTSAPPSAADSAATALLGQSKQYVYHGGEVTIVRPSR